MEENVYREMWHNLYMDMQKALIEGVELGLDSVYSDAEDHGRFVTYQYVTHFMEEQERIFL